MDSLDIGGCVQGFIEADGDLGGEFAIGLIESVDTIDDEIWFAAAAVNFSGDDNDVFGFDDIFVAGVVFGPCDAADDAGGIFEVEVGISGMSISAGFFGGGEFDGGDHTADGDLNAVFEFSEFCVAIGGVAFDAAGVLSERVGGEIEADGFFFELEFDGVCPFGEVGERGSWSVITGGCRFVIASEEAFLSSGFVFLF